MSFGSLWGGEIGMIVRNGMDRIFCGEMTILLWWKEILWKWEYVGFEGWGLTKRWYSKREKISGVERSRLITIENRSLEIMCSNIHILSLVCTNDCSILNQKWRLSELSSFPNYWYSNKFQQRHILSQLSNLLSTKYSLHTFLPVKLHKKINRAPRAPLHFSRMPTRTSIEIKIQAVENQH